MTLYDLIFSR